MKSKEKSTNLKMLESLIGGWWWGGGGERKEKASKCDWTDVTYKIRSVDYILLI